MRALFFSLAICLPAAVWGQQAALPRFEVASVKATPPDQWNAPSGGNSGHGRYTYSNVTLKRCIMGAFGLGPNQIVGGPRWLDSDRFEIVGKAGTAPDDDSVLDRMMQALLIERFQLAFHRENQMMPAYVLEAGKGGPKLEPSPGGEGVTRHGRGLIEAQATTMAHFAEVLSREMDAPVVDRTALSGIFNLKLKWTPESAQTQPDAGPSIYMAIEQLGLRLSGRKTAVEMFVIDRAEKPSEN